MVHLLVVSLCSCLSLPCTERHLVDSASRSANGCEARARPPYARTGKEEETALLYMLSRKRPACVASEASKRDKGEWEAMGGVERRKGGNAGSKEQPRSRDETGVATL
jgi:hypothetical protein